MSEAVGSAARLRQMNCDPEEGNEAFCFSLQSAVRCLPHNLEPHFIRRWPPTICVQCAHTTVLQELEQMDFPRLLLFHESKIYLMGKKVYMGPLLTASIHDFVRGGYRDKGSLEGAYDASKKCLPGAALACQVDFSFGDGLPVREDCMDLYKQCGKYAKDGKCDMYQHVCEISCGVCRMPPSSKSEL